MRSKKLPLKPKKGFQLNFRGLGPAPRSKVWIIVGLLVLTHLSSHYLIEALQAWRQGREPQTLTGDLYLLEEAGKFIDDLPQFEQKVRYVAAQLEVPPEWLMAVMYAESRFDARVKNYQGSGATGLIQFMPATAKALNVSIAQLQEMGAVAQMDYVLLYFQKVRSRYGTFHTLTDLYLGVIYPKALNQDYCFAMFLRPTRQYKQNAGLDHNTDGIVSVSDIDRHMQRLFPKAYIIPKSIFQIKT